MPPRSTKAPKSAMFLTVPLRSSPSVISDINASFILLRSSSISLRRETTILRRDSSILRITHWIFCPTKAPMSCGRRMSTWLAGRKTLTPMLTSSPPLILRRTSPVTTSSSECLAMTSSHSRIRSAFLFERIIRPNSSSISSSRTVTFEPGSGTSTTSSSRNSSIGTIPSLLYPISISTSSPSILNTVPSIMELSS